MKHHKLISVIAIFIFLAVFLTGGWDSVDINDKLIVTTIAFDVKGGEISFPSQVYLAGIIAPLLICGLSIFIV